MVLVADPGRADRPGEGNAGKGEGGGGANHGGDVGVLVLIGGHDRGHHLHLIHEPLGKEGPNGPVDEPRREGLLLGGPPLAAEETAGNLAGGVGLLLVVHREREEGGAGAPPRHADGGGQHHRVAHGDER